MNGYTISIISDEFDQRTELNTLAEEVILQKSDDFLRSILSNPASFKLRAIIASIQAQQYDLIEAASNQILVVQGSAGSGKTSVALHRLSFLLYPDNGSGIKEKRCIIFGPNKLFLNYLATVLPTLDLHNVIQTTPVDWALNRIKLSDHTVKDFTFELMLSETATGQEKDDAYSRSRIKTSLTMAKVLERFIAHLKKIVFLSEGWKFAPVGPLQVHPHLTYDELISVLKRNDSYPFVQQRLRFLEALMGNGQEEGLIVQAYRNAVKCETETGLTHYICSILAWSAQMTLNM